MAKRETLGSMKCPECGADGAEIKAQKNGLLYRWCGQGCNAQFFARNADQEYAMRKHVKPAPEPAKAPSATVTDTAPKAAPKAPEPAPELPKKKGTGNPFLDLMQGA